MNEIENFLKIKSNFIQSLCDDIKNSKLKINELAQLAGISRVHLSRILNKRVDNIRFSTIQKLDKALKKENL